MAAWAVAVACLATVLWQARNGFDLSDESLYLLSADPPRPGNAFNGLSGLYLRPMWTVAGWDVATVRTVGVLLLAAAGAVLGFATARLVGRDVASTAVVVAVAVAGSTALYAYGLRTPSYNTLAMAGAALTSAALLALLAGGHDRWGALAGAGLALATTGKVTTAAVLSVVVVAVVAGKRRPAVLAWAGVALAAAVAVHVLLVLSATGTVELLRRSAAFLAVLDPNTYTATGAMVATAAKSPVVVLSALVGGAPLGFLPVAAAGAPPERREAWSRALAVGTVVSVAAIALGTGIWSGVVDRGPRLGGGVVPLVAALVLAVVVGRRLRVAPGPGARPQLAGSAVLVAASAAYLAGSNLRLDCLLETATGLLGPACLLLAAALPRPARRAGVAAVAACLLAGSLVTAVQAREAPKRSADLDRAVVPVALGPATVRLDPATAASLERLVASARSAGWQEGTPLVDGSFTPAVPLALRARVPPVLVPAVPDWSVDAVCAAVRGLGPSWADAWLVLPDGGSPVAAQRAADALGRRYPQDYRSVATLDGPHLATAVTLLQPRPGPPAGTGCLS